MFYRIRIGAAIAALVVCSSSTSRAISAGRRATGMESDRADARAQRDSGRRRRLSKSGQWPSSRYRSMTRSAGSPVSMKPTVRRDPHPPMRRQWRRRSPPLTTRCAPCSRTTRGRWMATTQASLATHGVSSMDPGLEFGRSVAAGILALRSNDHASEAVFDYTVPGAGTPGVWERLGGAAALLPGWGAVTPFVMRSSSQFRPDGPPALDSEQYATDYNEIREIGSFTSTVRSTEQTGIANFWRASPTAIWNGVLTQALAVRNLDLAVDRPGVRAHVPGGSRLEHRVLGGEIPLQLLAAVPGDRQWRSG